MHAISILFVLLLQCVCLPLLVFQQAGVVMTDFVIILSPVTHRPASHDICHSMFSHTHTHTRTQTVFRLCVCANSCMSHCTEDTHHPRQTLACLVHSHTQKK